MSNLLRRLQTYFGQYWGSFSYVGLVVATFFFASSLTPSLLPRHYPVQGCLSGLALAVGYGLGVLLVALWHFLEIPEPDARLQWAGKRITSVCVAIVVGIVLWRATVWQNSIRQLMKMEPVESAYPWRVALIALVTSIVLITCGRGLAALWTVFHRRIQRVVPKRVSYVVTTLAVGVLVFMVVNDLFARLALNAADSFFLQLDKVVEDGIEAPSEAMASGSDASYIDWDTIGRRGKDFIAAGPKQEAIQEFWGKPVSHPLRVYVGLGSKESVEERAELALEELKRVGGFDRSVLVVATPTGTGWLDEGAVDTLEYLHAGDTAIVSMQYSYLPSWITILVDPQRSRVAARELFDKVYEYWKTRPQDRRPKLYLHGLSLGSLGSESSADLFTIFEDPIHGAVWSGPPFPSTVWARVTRNRNPDSTMWLPRFHDGSLVRFTGQENRLDEAGTRWGPMRFVYIQHASDPMTFFAPDLLYQRPPWLVGPRGPDVSPYLMWVPIITFLQVGFDLPMATSVSMGYGHNFSAASYIDAWIAVTDPPNWSEDDTRRLKERFVTEPE